MTHTYEDLLTLYDDLTILPDAIILRLLMTDEILADAAERSAERKRRAIRTPDHFTQFA
jgi:hypothetical protein